MIVELLIRFLIGGLIISVFSLIGDVLQPKSFAGIFGAAPSVALASLGLALLMHGGRYVSLEGRSMIAGAAALLIYSLVVHILLARKDTDALVGASTSWMAWVLVAFTLWGGFLR